MIAIRNNDSNKRTWHHQAAYDEICNKISQMFGIDDQVEPHHKERSKQNIAKGESAVQSLCSILGTNKSNTFMNAEDCDQL